MLSRSSAPARTRASMTPAPDRSLARTISEDVVLTEVINSFDMPSDIDIYTFKADYEDDDCSSCDSSRVSSMPFAE